MDKTYEAIMARKNEILLKSVGLDYKEFENDGIGFDFEKMMDSTGYDYDLMETIQRDNGVGNTPLLDLKNITKLARKYAKPGYGAKILLKDEACNASGSFKARRASISVYHAKKLGFKGVIAATSGNYGAAVASQAAKHGLKCIIVQECYDSELKGQPEIIEKARKCEAFGAEVVRLTVGPELFYQLLLLLEETGYFNASLYTPFGIGGVETLGYELAIQTKEKYGKFPESVVCTNAGGGNLTGTARGLLRANADSLVIAASVNLSGLHMASDKDFNKKSFTTGHTGFGIPFSINPDRSDVPRSAGRPLRYMDEYYTVSQGEVFFVTEMLAELEGLERGPAGNTSLAVAFSLAQKMKEDEIIVVQETEYTGAGKHIQPQLSFAIENGINVEFGNPKDEVPGKSIILPRNPSLISARKLNIDDLRKSYLRSVIKVHSLTKNNLVDTDYLCEELRIDKNKLEKLLGEI
ncbi:PLP-dependent lyase/thiolase [Mycoplasmatota bacterium]|nr:PLP-dependent lyase/thiolase [Mycoplasmatota bacterium]